MKILLRRLLPKTYQLYLWQELFKTGFLFVLIFAGFYLVIDFFEKLSDFLKFHKPLYLFLTYIFWKAIVNVYEIFPFACGLSVLFFLFWLSRTNELIAFLSVRISRQELFREILKGMIFLGIVGGILLNLILPRATYNALYVWEYRIEGKKAQHLVFGDQIFFTGENFYLLARPLEPKGEYLSDLTLVFFSSEGVERIIWAKRGYYVKKRWTLEEVVLQDKKDQYSPKIWQNLEYQFPLSPRILSIVEKPIHFLSFAELLKRLKFLKKTGQPYKEVMVELYLKCYYLFVPFLLSVFSVFVYLKMFVPKGWQRGAFYSFTIFMSLLLVFITLQGFLRKGVTETLYILSGWLILGLFFYLWQSYLVFWKKSGKN